jgi:hypothetical protein
MTGSTACSMAMTEPTAVRAGLHPFAPRPGARKIRVLNGNRAGRLQRDHRAEPPPSVPPSTQVAFHMPSIRSSSRISPH